MKKWILTVTMVLLSAVVAWGQHYRIVIDSVIPSPASEVLQQRFTQMLEAGGLIVAVDSVAADSEPADFVAVGDGPMVRNLIVTGKIISRMETPGEMSQMMLAVDVEASCGLSSASFPLKGVGDNETDAWLRAVKQLLPRSKAAQSFIASLH